jgi:hypothetical protein
MFIAQSVNRFSTHGLSYNLCESEFPPGGRTLRASEDLWGVVYYPAGPCRLKDFLRR